LVGAVVVVVVVVVIVVVVVPDLVGLPPVDLDADELLFIAIPPLVPDFVVSCTLRVAVLAGAIAWSFLHDVISRSESNINPKTGTTFQ
jgi:hypothetical protein